MGPTIATTSAPLIRFLSGADDASREDHDAGEHHQAQRGQPQRPVEHPADHGADDPETEAGELGGGDHRLTAEANALRNWRMVGANELVASRKPKAPQSRNSTRVRPSPLCRNRSIMPMAIASSTSRLMDTRMVASSAGRGVSAAEH